MYESTESMKDSGQKLDIKLLWYSMKELFERGQIVPISLQNCTNGAAGQKWRKAKQEFIQVIL